MTDTTAGEGVKNVVADLRIVYSDMTPGRLERCDSDGHARRIDAAIQLIEALAAQPSAGAQGEAVAWRWRIPGLLSWNVSLTADVRIQGAIVEPLYTTPAQPDTGDVAALREVIIEAVKDAMTDAWADICSDTGCWPADLKRVGKSPVRLEYRPAIWTESTAEMAANRILAALSKPNAQGADLTMKVATQASDLSVHATRLADALQVLKAACEDADRMEELPFNIDGSMIDAANAALDAYRPATTPEDGGA